MSSRGEEGFAMFDRLTADGFGSPINKAMSGQTQKPAYKPKRWTQDPYYMLSSMGLGYQNAPTQVTYETLYQMAKQNHIVGIVHKTICAKVSAYMRRPKHKYDIGFKVVHREKDPHAYTPAIRKRIREIEDFFLHSGLDEHPEKRAGKKLIYSVMQDLLTYDQGNIELVPTRSGALQGMWYAAAMNFRLSYPANRAGRPTYDLEYYNRTPQYMQVDRNRIIQTFGEDQLTWITAFPRTTLFGQKYGYSPLEQLITAVTGVLWSEQWNLNQFAQGSHIPGIFNLAGNLSKEKLEDFRRQWLLQAQGVWNAHRQVFLNTQGIEFVPLTRSNNEMGYSDWQQYLIQVICLMYRVSPTTCGFQLRGEFGSSMRMASASRSHQTMQQQQNPDDDFLATYTELLENEFNSYKIMGRIDPDFMFQFYGVQKKDEEKDIDNRQKELETFRTVEEIRRDQGLPDLPDDPKPWQIPLNPTLTGLFMQEKTMAMDEQHRAEDQAREDAQMAQMGPEGAGGGGQFSSQDFSSAPASQQELFANGQQSGKKPQPTAKEEQVNKSLRVSREEYEAMILGDDYDVFPL